MPFASTFSELKRAIAVGLYHRFWNGKWDGLYLWPDIRVATGLLIVLAAGRARIPRRGPIGTITETVTIGVAAAVAGVTISGHIDRA